MSQVHNPNVGDGPIPKPTPRPKAAPKYLNQSGKAAKQRAADKRTLLKNEPATHAGLHYCYIGAHWVQHFDLEHVIDASERPDLRDNPRNHKKACNPHNLAKKAGTLTPPEQARVAAARNQVLEGSDDWNR
jgi:hypothetical protein